jgi:hypothetical protein
MPVDHERLEAGITIPETRGRPRGKMSILLEQLYYSKKDTSHFFGDANFDALRSCMRRVGGYGWASIRKTRENGRDGIRVWRK